MSLPYALLALLLDCPSSGYDLNKRFETSVGCFWKASHQQIYRELSKLEQAGWVEAEHQAQSGKPDKKIYHLTAIGREELARWTAQPCDITPIKEEILVKLFSGGLVDPTVIRQHLEAHRRQYQGLLALYRTLETTAFPGDVTALTVPDHLRYLTLRCGIHYATGWIAWCDESLAYLDSVQV